MIGLFAGQRGQMNPMGPMGQGGTVNTLLWVIIGLLIVIIVYLWYSGRSRGKEEPVESSETVDMDKIEVALRLLNPNEATVVEALIERGGEMLQKDMHYELDMTRVQAHRVVQGLVQRGLVTIESHYNTNKVILADWLLG